MANLLGTLRVRLTAETEDFVRGLASAKTRVDTFEKSMSKFANSTLSKVASVGAMTVAVHKALDAAKQLDAAERALAGSAQIAGQDINALQAIVSNATAKFGLSKLSATQYATELSKLADVAGGLKQPSQVLQSFLDLGAARGMNAAKTLETLKQAVKGSEEGVVAFFNRKPDALYASFAASIGKTASQLSAQQKAQALANAALTEGASVRGEYQKWLGTVEGMQFSLAQGMESSSAVLGRALQPALIAALPVMKLATDAIVQMVAGFEAFMASLKALPGFSQAIKLALTGNFVEARKQIAETSAEWSAAVAKIRENAQKATAGADIDLTGRGAAGAGDAGKKLAKKYFESLEAEWENLSHRINLANIEVTGTDIQRLKLEEEHALRLLDIEEKRLKAAAKLGELTPKELTAALGQVADRRLMVEVEHDSMASATKENKRLQKLKDAREKRKAGAMDLGADVFNTLLSGGKLDGAQIGSQLGALAGSAIPIPVLGPMIGTALGSLFGGLFGKNKKDSTEAPIIKGLDAIERAQRETITAITAQTDALLKPESRLMNLPASFSVPAMAPAFFSGGGGSPVTYADNRTVTVNINATGGHSANDIKRLAYEGLVEALADGRRGGPSGGIPMAGSTRGPGVF